MKNAVDHQFLVSEILDLLGPLIACDTSFPPGAGYVAFSELLADMCKPLGGTTEIVDVPDKLWAALNAHGIRRNLIFRPDLGPSVQSAKHEILIYFHTDTAPVGRGWTYPPLTMTQHNGRVYGRGAADMKGAIAAVLAALRYIKDSGLSLAFRPALAFCTDEEGGQYPGIRYLAETRPLPPAILNLNGSASPRIWAGCFGSLNLRLLVRGHAVHSGEPERGANAFDLALPAIESIMRLKAQVETRVSAMSPPPNAVGPLRARLNITSVHAGSGPSAIPGDCEITINRRYMPEEDESVVRSELTDTIRAAFADRAEIDWSLDDIGHLPPVVDPEGQWTGGWVAARAEAFGLSAAEFTRYGSGTSSDFGWVQRAGYQHILLGGLSRPDRNVHGPDEFTTTDDLAALAKAITLFLSGEYEGAAEPPLMSV